MKKISCIVCVFAILFLLGCNSNSDSNDTTDTTTGFDYNESYSVNDPIAEYDTYDKNSLEGFSISTKKYEYKEKNIVIAKVENHTDVNYTLTVSITYFDETGNELKIEKQKHDDFSAKWQRYFLFEPELAFDSYTYEITKSEWTAECISDKITFEMYEVSHSYIPENLQLVPGVKLKYSFINGSSYTLDITIKAIVFSNDGNVFAIQPDTHYMEISSNCTKEADKVLCTLADDKTDMPNELVGNVGVIFIISNISSK